MIRHDCSDIDEETFLNYVVPANDAVKNMLLIISCMTMLLSI